MKISSPLVLLTVLVLGAAALSSVKRVARSEAARRGRGACCPLVPAWEAMPLPPGTNAPVTTGGTPSEAKHP